MMKCEKCGHELAAQVRKMPKLTSDDDAILKDEVLAELMQLMEGSLGDKLGEGKPAVMSIEVIKSKKDDEEEEV